MEFSVSEYEPDIDGKMRFLRDEIQKLWCVAVLSKFLSGKIFDWPLALIFALDTAGNNADFIPGTKLKAETEVWPQ
jgi:hypothetical protein